MAAATNQTRPQTVDFQSLLDSPQGSLFVRIAVPLVAPFFALLCEASWEMLAVAVSFSLFLLPGTLWLAKLNSFFFSPGSLAGSTGTATAVSLALFSFPAAFSTLLHLEFDTFIYLYAGTYIVACLGAILWKGNHTNVQKDCAWSLSNLPAFFSSTRECQIILAGSAAVFVGTAFGSVASGQFWWISVSIGFIGGIGALLAVAFRRRRSPVPNLTKEDGSYGSSRARQSSGLTPTQSLANGMVCSRGTCWIARVFWLATALLTLYMMVVAYERDVYDWDDVTYVSQAVDFLYGGPMDLWEPSLGLEIPQQPGRIIPTIPLLTAFFSFVTKLPSASLNHTFLPPLFVLSGVSVLAVALSVVLQRHQFFVPLAMVIVLLVLLKSSDEPRSFTNFLFYRTIQPKSIHYLILMPLQLCTLVALASRPTRTKMALVIGLGVVGHCIHPWSTALGGVWSGALLVFTLLYNRRAVSSLAIIMIVFALLGGLYTFKAKQDSIEMGLSQASGRPSSPIELVVDESTAQARLDVQATLGTYSLFRFGVLSLPFAMILGLKIERIRAVAFLSLAALLIAYFEPFSSLFASVMERELLWRTRFMVPSLFNGVFWGVTTYCAATSLFRKTSKFGEPIAAIGGAAIVVCSVVAMVFVSSSNSLQRSGPLKHPTKLHPLTLLLYEDLGGRDGDPYFLVPFSQRYPVSAELPQMMPRVKLIVSRNHIVRSYLGQNELLLRRRLLDRFYAGEMKESEFEGFLRQFPVNTVAVDFLPGTADKQIALLKSKGWVEGNRFGHLEIWRQPFAALR